MRVTDVHCSFHAPGLMSQINMNPKAPHHRRDSHRTDLRTIAHVHRSQLGRRRSTRMALSASVGLSGEDRQKCSFTMPARATNLNKHGGAVQLKRDLSVGSVVVVRNQHGAEISARVVAQVAGLQGVPTYAIEFVEHDEKATNFWGITFPSNA